MRLASMALIAAAFMLAGCWGGSGPRADELRDGVYEFELTEGYLLRHGVPAPQARRESGIHEVTLDRGSFVERWRSEEGWFDACWGAYVANGNRVTFHWTGGCTGDWAMSFSRDGELIRWSSFEPLDPEAGPEEQEVTEVFNSVPWMRVGDAPTRGEQ
jgi:hypothetical protein